MNVHRSHKNYFFGLGKIHAPPVGIGQMEHGGDYWLWLTGFTHIAPVSLVSRAM